MEVFDGALPMSFLSPFTFKVPREQWPVSRYISLSKEIEGSDRTRGHHRILLPCPGTDRATPNKPIDKKKWQQERRKKGDVRKGLNLHSFCLLRAFKRGRGGTGGRGENVPIFSFSTPKRSTRISRTISYLVLLIFVFTNSFLLLARHSSSYSLLLPTTSNFAQLCQHWKEKKKGGSVCIQVPLYPTKVLLQTQSRRRRRRSNNPRSPLPRLTFVF